jgi:hypothetical protein
LAIVKLKIKEKAIINKKDESVLGKEKIAQRKHSGSYLVRNENERRKLSKGIVIFEKVLTKPLKKQNIVFK